MTLGGAFFGESMYHLVRDASKVALVHLVERLRERKFELLDTQATTPHLRKFGCVDIPAREYLARLRRALALPLPPVWGCPGRPPAHSSPAAG